MSETAGLQYTHVIQSNNDELVELVDLSEYSLNAYTNMILSSFDPHVSYQTHENSSSNDDALTQSFNDQSEPRFKQIISDIGKQSLRKIIYKQNGWQFNTECYIDLMPFEENQEITQLPCNHCFMTDSIERWLQTEKAECPVCRKKIDSIEVRTNYRERYNSIFNRYFYTNRQA